ncbi:type IV secretion system protein TrbL [Azotobacter beijerinckii]|uniref:Type IV secretion system protein TrbL n=2 Tax=Azotobacter beijerinckii TaxID=170623 RepID=A0A1H9K3H6_9GAMM|nr:P-type conjugative transfer protein TrbL [Azotobacter beijerinckii]SEQ93395.1 type IV secretion system protein TrbL [Azotobacter beijerinckii]
MRMSAAMKNATLPLFVGLAFFTFTVDVHAAIDNAGLLDTVLERYSAAAGTWATFIKDAASRLFWLLVVISMVWTFGMMALRKADIAEFFAEFIRFTIFTGFFWWLLTNGPAFADAIMRSLRQLAGEATGLGGTLSPSGIVDIGFEIFGKVLDQSSVWAPVDSACGIILAGIILVILALIGVNMLLLLISGWILAYAGVFFLGFGGSRWTSDMAVNYYKTVLGVAAQLMSMVLLVGIGKTFLDDYYNAMSEGIKLKEMGVMLIVTVILLVLTNKIPQLISGIITGASVGGAGIGNFGAGAAVGTTGMVVAAAATGGAALASGAANISGGAQALMTAFNRAQNNVAASTDITSKVAGAFSSDNSATSGSSPLASAMGLGSTGSIISFGTPSFDSTAGGNASESGSQQADKGSSKLGTAGRIAADMSANLAGGIGRMAKDKALDMVDSAKASVAETAGGRLAQEISNPGARAQERSDNLDIAKADTIMSQQARAEQAAEARQFLAQQSASLFEGNSIGGAENNDVDVEDEVAAFRDRNQNS